MQIFRGFSILFLHITKKEQLGINPSILVATMLQELAYLHKNVTMEEDDLVV
jgi:hypothetical protein